MEGQTLKTKQKFRSMHKVERKKKEEKRQSGWKLKQQANAFWPKTQTV